MVKVKDKFWLFASRAHDDDPYFHNSGSKSIWSRITPAEGAMMLGLDNIIMISSDGIPVPFSKDAFGYMESFCKMKKVMWSVTGSAGFYNGNEEEWICSLAEKHGNVCGAFYDDFTCDNSGDVEVKYSEEYLTEFLDNSRKKLDKACRPIEMWSTCYIEDVETYSPDMYKNFDGITVWSTDTEVTEKLEENFALYEKLLPDKKKMLGIYLFNYRKRESIPVELMKKQCETGLKWLREGRIEGMIFLTNCVMGIGLESEYWLRDWIDKVGDEEL